MANFRKILATLSTVAILSTLVVTTAVSAASYTDVPANHWAKSYVDNLVDLGVFTGTGSFRPADNMSRAEFVKSVVVAAGLEGSTAITFPDVKDGDWFAPYVKTAVANGVINGYANGNFGPNDSLTREQAAKITVNAFDLPATTPTAPSFSDVPATAWSYSFVETLVSYGVVSGYGNGKFGPTDAVKREQVAKIISLALNPEAPVDGEVVVGGGDVDVSISSETPSGATLPSGATSVKMASWDFAAGAEDAKLSSVTIQRFGVWTMPTSHQVYLYDGSDRLTSGKNVNSTTNEVVFNNLGVEITAGDTKTLTLRMDVGDNSAGTTGEVGFEILDSESVNAGEGSISGDFPARGEMFGVSTTAAGTVTVEKNGTVTNPKVGQKDVTIAKFKISAATENADLEELGLYVGGNVNPSDVQDLKLYVTGTADPIATVDGLNAKDVAQFMLDTPYRIAKGDTKNMWVVASFNTGRSGDTVLAYVDESTDVVAIGDKYGYGMGVTMALYDGNADSCASASSVDCTYSALEGGDITISGTSIANRNLAINQDDVTVMKFTIVAATDVTFNNFMMMLDAGATAEATSTDAGLWKDSDNSANFTDIKIKEVGGDHVWGPIDADVLDSDTAGTNIVDGTDTDQAYYLFTDDLVMAAGDQKDFELTLDVANNSALSLETLTAGIYVNSSYPEMKDVNNKVLTNSTSLVPTGSYTADTFTVKTNSLTVAKSAAVGSATKVIGTNNIPMLALSVGSGDASATKITSLTLTGYVDNDGSQGAGAFVAGVETKTFAEMVLGVNIYKGSVSEANKLNVSAKAANATTGLLTFDNLSWTIPAGQTETLIVTGNLANSSAYNNYAVKVDIADVSAHIIAEDSNGNTVTSASTDNPNLGTTDLASASILISSGGTLTVDVPSNTPASKVAVAGTTGAEFAKLKLTAARESFTIDKLALRNSYSAAAGDYDDNISALKVKYFTDAAQTVEATTTCASSATAGYYTCSGMNMYVPDADLSSTPDYATLTIVADLADVANSQADEGDLPEFTLAFNYDLEATGVGSSTKITENTVSITDAAVASFLTTGLASGSLVNELNESNVTAADTTITVVTGTEFHVGDILCMDTNDGGSCGASEEQLYVVSISTNDLTVVRGINGTTADATSANDAGDGFLRLGYTSALDTNLMEVRATNMTVTAVAARTGSTNATEQVMTMTAVANAAKDVTLRQGYTLSAANESTDTGANFTVVDDFATALDGASEQVIWGAAGDQTDSTVIFPGTGFNNYARVSFWLLWHDDSASRALDASDIDIFTSTDGTVAAGQATALTITDPAEDVWTLVDMALPTGTDSSDVNFGFQLDESALVDTDNATAASDYLLIDRVIFYNEKVNVDLTLNKDWASATPTVAYLKQNGTTVATSYVDFDGATTTKTGQITFIPVSTYSDIEINGTDTFVVEMNTAGAITDDSSSTEKLTVKADLGAYGTAGDIYWYDGAGTTTYLGVSATDNISTVTSY